MRLFPAPFRFKEYELKLRSMTKTLTFHWVCGLQFAAMSIQGLLLLDRAHYNTFILVWVSVFILFLYGLSFVLSIFEVTSDEGYPWEKYFMPSCMLIQGDRKGMAKSRLVQVSAELLKMPLGLKQVFYIICVVGGLVCIPTCFMIRSFLDGSPAFERLDDFGAFSLLYTTIMMMAGYFLTFQPREREDNPFTGWFLGNLDIKVRWAIDALMTQGWPFIVQAVGAWWIDTTVPGFIHCFATWCLEPSPYLAAGLVNATSIK